MGLLFMIKERLPTIFFIAYTRYTISCVLVNINNQYYVVISSCSPNKRTLESVVSNVFIQTAKIPA